VKSVARRLIFQNEIFKRPALRVFRAKELRDDVRDKKKVGVQETATKVMGLPGSNSSGELVVRDLQPGEALRVHPGHVGAFQASVLFQITTVPGIKS
jgi:hypothetical protein